VFWNKDETALYVVTQADPAANLLVSTAVAPLSPSAALQPTDVRII
jgi:hypothetical protein